MTFVGQALGVVVLLGLSTGWTATDAKVNGPYRASLEARLKTLEDKKAELEATPGTLDKQRQYQARIETLKAKLGQAVLPFQLPAAAAEEAAAKAVSTGPGVQEVDYFHDRSQIVAVDKMIQEKGGIRPQSTWDEPLVRTNHRAVSKPPAHGVLLDGDQGPPLENVATLMALPPVATSVSAESTLAARDSALVPAGPASAVIQQAAVPLSFQNGMPPSQAPGAQPVGVTSPSPWTSAVPSGSVPSTGVVVPQNPFPPPAGTPPAFGVPPATGMGPGVWKQPAEDRDYANKVGWSVPPPPITMPLIPGPGYGYGPGRAAAYAPPHDGRLSFSPQRLMHLWPVW
ncbi:MAG: hypothetical protein ACK5PQ_02455 [Alphaproteobacteria bacterium]